MKAWLDAEQGGALEKFGFRIVFHQREAQPVHDNNVGEVLKAAIREHPDYDWVKVRGQKPGYWLVEGTKR